MKKTILAALISFLALPVMADFSNAATASDNSGTELNVLPENGTSEMNMSVDRNDHGDRDSRDRDDRWDDSRDSRHDRDRDDGRWDDSRGGHHSRVTCIAANQFRQRFMGMGWNQWQARRQALYSCQSRSHSRCYIMRCYSRGGRY